MLGALTEASSVVPNQHGKERQLLALLVDEAALVLQARCQPPPPGRTGHQ